MSEETVGTSQEERFLGVRTTIEPPEDDNNAENTEELQIEVVDDRPQEDQRGTPATKAETSDDDGVADDDELKEVGQSTTIKVGFGFTKRFIAAKSEQSRSSDGYCRGKL